MTRQHATVPNQFAEDPAARREIELAAMQAVMAAERALGHAPVDVSAQKVGYDIASHDPKSGHLRFIEVKGRIDGADSVMITRQEVITSLHEPEKFIPGDRFRYSRRFAHEPRYVRGPLVEREPSFLETAIQFDLRRLLERAGRRHEPEHQLAPVIAGPPDYFHPIQERAPKRWDQLEADPELAGPWHQLFKQVRSPRECGEITIHPATYRLVYDLDE